MQRLHWESGSVGVEHFRLIKYYEHIRAGAVVLLCLEVGRLLKISNRLFGFQITLREISN